MIINDKQSLEELNENKPEIGEETTILQKINFIFLPHNVLFDSDVLFNMYNNTSETITGILFLKKDIKEAG
jgi:hypothetical protein